MPAALVALLLFAPQHTAILANQLPRRLAVDGNGNAWVAANAAGHGRVTKLDADG